MFCISSFHNVSDQFFFISSYYMSISPQSSFNFSTMSSLHIFWSLHSIMSLTSSSSFLLITCSYHLNLPSSSLQCLPLHIFRSFHSIMSLTSSSSFLLITCSYPDLPSSYLQCFASLHFIMFLTSYSSFFLLHVHITSIFLHLLYTVLHSTSSDLFIPKCLFS